MKIIKSISVLCLLVLFISCSKDDSNILAEDQSQTKNFVFHYQSQSFKVDYKLEADSIVLLSELPKELIELRDNEDIILSFGEDNNLFLTEKEVAAPNNFEFLNTKTTSNTDVTINLNFFENFGLDNINHYGFVVNNKETALNNYSEEYAIGYWYQPQLTTKKYFINGVDQGYTVDLIFGFAGNDQIEILETDVNENSIFANFLKEQEGLHHLGFSVKDLEKTTKLFNDNGYSTSVSGEFKTKLGLVSKIRFFDTRAETGLYTEIVEAKLLGFNVTQNKALLNFGLLLGDVKIVLPNY